MYCSSLHHLQYAVVFMDYFTSVPEKLLSNRGPDFLSTLVQEVCKLLGTTKVNTSGYHPQCDGLVEKFNSRLINMWSKSVDKYVCDWDKHLPYLFFAYRVDIQESTKASPFYLLYGREPQVPTASTLSKPRTAYQVDFPDYCTEFVAHLSDALALAHKNIKRSQRKQKAQYDKKTSESTLQVGARVMVHFPSQVTGKAWKGLETDQAVLWTVQMPKCSL